MTIDHKKTPRALRNAFRWEYKPRVGGIFSLEIFVIVTCFCSFLLDFGAKRLFLARQDRPRQLVRPG